jgi:uncharacterized protein (DUF2384 family)
MGPWSLPLQEIKTPKNLARLSDVVPLLDRLESALGTRPLAKLLDASPTMVSNWKARRYAISSKYAKRVIELHDALVRALQVLDPDAVMEWLVGHEPFLNFARPIDVLVTRGASPLIDALAAIEATGYA